MTYPLHQVQQQKLKQLQNIIMTAKMQQAIKLMQLPVLEITTIIDAELEQNPILEIIEEDEITEISQDEELPTDQELNFDEKNFEILKQIDESSKENYLEGAGFSTRKNAEEEKKKNYEESLIQAKPSLFEHLMGQAKEYFHQKKELQMAEELIGNFDESGFLTMPLNEIALTQNFNENELKEVLKVIQGFEPIGVGATNLQESLLIQLRNHFKTESLASEIIDKHFDDLIHNRIPNIKKGLGCSIEEIRKAIEDDIARLDLRPGASCSLLPVQSIIPDLTIKEDDGELLVHTNSDYIPSLRLNRRYLKMLEDESLSKEEKDFIKNKILSAKWLMKNIDQRNSTLEKIAYSLIKHQKNFFTDPTGKLVPLVMKEVAEELSLNESTVARAVANKYIDTPRGIFPLRYFFSKAYETVDGENISSKTVREFLKELIDGEDKKKPLSDEILSKLIKEKGITCARRTVAKYRLEMNIGNTTQRKEY